MKKKLLGILFILGSISSFTEENLTIHDLKMKMEIDKTKPNHIVVNIVPDDTEERIEAILKNTETIKIEKSNLSEKDEVTSKKKEQKKIIIEEKISQNEVQHKIIPEKKIEKLEENKIKVVEEQKENIEKPQIITEEKIPLQKEKMPLGIVVSMGIIVVGVISFLYSKYKKR